MVKPSNPVMVLVLVWHMIIVKRGWAAFAKCISSNRAVHIVVVVSPPPPDVVVMLRGTLLAPPRLRRRHGAWAVTSFKHQQT